jgi:hypothetical protein
VKAATVLGDADSVGRQADTDRPGRALLGWLRVGSLSGVQTLKFLGVQKAAVRMFLDTSVMAPTYLGFCLLVSVHKQQADNTPGSSEASGY